MLARSPKIPLPCLNAINKIAGTPSVLEKLDEGVISEVVWRSPSLVPPLAKEGFSPEEAGKESPSPHSCESRNPEGLKGRLAAKENQQITAVAGWGLKTKNCNLTL
jgi:hypothetical protein